MLKKAKVIFFTLLGLGLISLPFWLIDPNNLAVLDPMGIIAKKQKDLILTATGLMLIVVIPVFVMTFVIAWRYRASNKNAKYSPDWVESMKAEAIWWGVPCIIIAILAVIVWKKTHELDPYKPIDPHAKPLVIQAVALQWKWLFIYPEQKIAIVNDLHFPAHVPLRFEITADAPMNSFWIPQLGGQIYAMPAMRTFLNLIANETGVYRGSSANLSGRDFADMWFYATAEEQHEFDAWVDQVRSTSNVLHQASYLELAEPGKHPEHTPYVLGQEDLFDEIVMKYMRKQS